MVKNLIVSLLALCLFGCENDQKRPIWDGKVFSGDSETQSVVRKQTGESISCAESKFNDGIWISYRDFGCLFDLYINNIKEFVDASKVCTRPMSEDASDMHRLVEEYTAEKHRKMQEK